MWIHIYDFIVLMNFIIEYKARSKMKIKKSLKSKQFKSRNQQIIVEIFAQFTYKIVLFFDCKMRIQNDHLFEQIQQKLYIWNICCFRIQNDSVFQRIAKIKNVQFRNFRINIRFRFSNLQNDYLILCNCDESKTLFLWILDIFRYLFYEFHCFTYTTWSVWFYIRCQNCYTYENLFYMFGNDLTSCCRKRQLVMKESCWKEEVRNCSSNETLESIELNFIDMT